jgi:hypothetical protein
LICQVGTDGNPSVINREHMQVCGVREYSEEEALGNVIPSGSSELLIWVVSQENLQLLSQMRGRSYFYCISSSKTQTDSSHAKRVKESVCVFEGNKYEHGMTLWQ